MLSTDQYRAFGTPTTTASTTDCFGFGGQWGDYTDGASHLVLCTHRYYDPAAGRFLTRDPIGYAGGLNLYAYCGNNPVNESDPSGHNPAVVAGVIVLLGGGPEDPVADIVAGAYMGIVAGASLELATNRPGSSLYVANNVSAPSPDLSTKREDEDRQIRDILNRRGVPEGHPEYRPLRDQLHRELGHIKIGNNDRSNPDELPDGQTPEEVADELWGPEEDGINGRRPVDEDDEGNGGRGNRGRRGRGNNRGKGWDDSGWAGFVMSPGQYGPCKS